MVRNEVLDVLRNRPVAFGRLAGFKDLRELHNDWIKEFLYGTEDFTLQAHRGSYKTTCISIALALMLMLYPERKIFFMRKTDNDVKEVVAQVRKILEGRLMQETSLAVWGVPIRLTTSNAGELDTNYDIFQKGTSQLTAQGLGGSLTGKHFDLIFTDDIVNLTDRVSQSTREQTKLVYQELQNIRNRGGRIVNTGTPWHAEDCFSLMPNIHRFDCYSTGLMTDAQIEEVKASMIPSLFSANYELKHIADEKALFVNPQTIADDMELLRDGICHIDASYGGEDYTAFTIARRRDGKTYVLGRLWPKHVDNCIPEILELKKRYMTGKTYCEDNGDKGYLKKALRDFGDEVASYHEKMNKFVKISTFVYRAWPNVVFLDSTDPQYLSQVTQYTEDAQHDDAPDSLACILRKLDKVDYDEYKSPFEMG